MQIDSLRSSLAVSFAAVFLILLLCVLAITRKPSAEGVILPIPKVRTYPFNDCYDDRSVWVLLFKDGRIRINETPISRNELKPLISQIYAYRQEANAIFMRVDPEVPYADFVNAYNDVASAHPGLRVGVITNDLRRHLEACPKDAACGLDWPDHEYIPWCIAFNIAPVTIPHKSSIQK